MNDTYELIKQMTEELEAQRRIPFNVSLVEIVKRSNKSQLLVIEDIKQLQKERKIRVWRGLNDNLIQLVYDKRRV